jgi:hypothetical protein
MLITLRSAETVLEINYYNDLDGDKEKRQTSFGRQLGVLKSAWKEPCYGPQRRLQRRNCGDIVYEKGFVSGNGGGHEILSHEGEG